MPLDPIYNLSALEKQIMNYSTQEIENTVLLGERFQDALTLIEGAKVAAGTPRNAAFAHETLNIDGVVVHGESVGIGEDVYVFLADDAQVKFLPQHIAVDISAVSTKATINLTLATQPTSGDTFKIGDKTYIFVPVGTDTADGEVSIGADLAEAQVNLVAAVNGTDGISEPNPVARAGEFAANISAITALIGGVLGDAIATIETFDAVGNVFAAVALAGGVDCIASAAVTALVTAITAHDTQGVGAADGADDTVVLTADAAGAAGNEIALSENMAHGEFDAAATALSGGVDGTVGAAGALMQDDTYLYVAILANTVAGRNWRRIAVGNVF